jgi:hypothetical protein
MATTKINHIVHDVLNDIITITEIELSEEETIAMEIANAEKVAQSAANRAAAIEKQKETLKAFLNS